MDDDCTLKVVCGTLELPTISVDVSGDTSTITAASLTATVTANAVDCTCPNNLHISSTCLGQTAQPTAMGYYEPVCTMSDGTTAYIHIDPVVNMYTYHFNDVS